MNLCEDESVWLYCNFMNFCPKFQFAEETNKCGIVILNLNTVVKNWGVSFP